MGKPTGFMEYKRQDKIAEAPEIEFCHVSYCYSTEKEQQYALKDINLKIRAGEKLAIVGVNGAGKTTLIKCISGLVAPTSGSVYFDNVNLLKNPKYYKENTCDKREYLNQ